MRLSKSTAILALLAASLSLSACNDQGRRVTTAIAMGITTIATITITIMTTIIDRASADSQVGRAERVG